MANVCWNCKNDIPKGIMTCPHCQVIADRSSIGRVAIVSRTNASVPQIIPGVVVASRYEVEREVGRGGMGIVYRARDKFMDRDVALKVIPYELAMDPKAINDLKRETSVALDLTHEHIVRLYNLDTWEGLTFVTMEYVPSGTLSHLIVEKGGNLTIDEALPILRQVAGALDYAHGRTPPVIHRDLKPLNILLTTDGDAKVADFGLARVLRDLATRISAWEAAGTLAYMAPEQIRGKGVGTWTDVYALAAVAYELISGSPPFYTGDLRWQIMNEAPEYIQGLPEQQNKALLAGLAKDQDNRPATATDFVNMFAGEQNIPQFVDKFELVEITDEDAEPEPLKSSPPRLKRERKPIPPFLKKSMRRIFILAVIACLSYFIIGGGYIGKLAHLISTKSKSVISDVSDSSEPESEVIKEKQKIKIKLPESKIDTAEKGKTDIKVLPPKLGGIDVTSDPSMAEVYLDGNKLGRTPLQLSNVKIGQHEIEVKKSGYAEWSKKISIRADKMRPIKVTLVSKYGNLFVNTRPEGAKVYLDGRSKGKTPLRLKKVEVGHAKLLVKKDCFSTVHDRIEIKPEEETFSDIDLTPICGELRVSSVPNGADWFLDGKSMGKTPGRTDQVKKGGHSIKIVKDRYNPWTTQIDISAGKKEQVMANLDFKTPKPGDSLKEPLTGMDFVWVPAGCYKMGSSVDEPNRGIDEGPLHEVCVDGFWIGKYEVTQGQWSKAMGSNPSFFKFGDNFPVENVSWDDVKTFCKKIEAESRGEWNLRLPTEAEWEYACRSGGKREIFSGGNDVDAVAWHRGNSNEKTHAVGGKLPNGLGIYDMSGNVYEWVADFYLADAYISHKRKNPIHQVKGEYRVCRGGSWFLNRKECRSANRSYYAPNSRNYNLGFRLVKKQ